MLKAKSKIKHDGQIFQAGQELPKMSERNAQSLVRAGSAEFVEDVVEAPKVSKVVKSKSEEKRVKVQKEAKEKAGELKVNARSSKADVVAYAEAKGLKFEDSANRDEIYAIIKASENPESATEVADKVEDEDETEDETPKE